MLSIPLMDPSPSASPSSSFSPSSSTAASASISSSPTSSSSSSFRSSTIEPVYLFDQGVYRVIFNVDVSSWASIRAAIASRLTGTIQRRPFVLEAWDEGFCAFVPVDEKGPLKLGRSGEKRLYTFYYRLLSEFDTLSFSEIRSGDVKVLKEAFGIRVIPHSDHDFPSLPETFRWIDNLSEPLQADRYMPYLEQLLEIKSMPSAAMIDVNSTKGIPRPLYTILPPPRSPIEFSLSGNTDVLVGDKTLIDLKSFAEASTVLIELKKQVSAAWVNQAFAEQIAADLAGEKYPLTVLTDLDTEWHLMWFITDPDNENKLALIHWRMAPARAVSAIKAKIMGTEFVASDRLIKIAETEKKKRNADHLINEYDFLFKQKKIPKPQSEGPYDNLLEIMNDVSPEEQREIRMYLAQQIRRDISLMHS